MGAEPQVSSDFRGTDRFVVQRRIGAGAFGTVYEALDRERETVVALKTLTRLDAEALYRFKREFRALSDVSHENLVELHELHSDGEQWFFTMERLFAVDFLSYVWGGFRSDAPPAVLDGDGSLVRRSEPPARDGVARAFQTLGAADFGTTLMNEGPTLLDASTSGDFVATDPALATGLASRRAHAVDLERLRRALAQLGRGLACLHDAGLLHCDIKPSNVLVTEAGRVVLLDFGIAHEIGATAEASIDLAGTPAYMSPEQTLGEKPTFASDWYGVGVMLFHALVGRPPFVGSPSQIVRAKQRFEPARPSRFSSVVPKDLDELCFGLLRRNDRERSGRRDFFSALGEPERVESSGPVRAASIPKLRTGPTLIGRDGPLLLLRRAFASATTGGATGKIALAFVHGESGMGKSALVRHFLDGYARPARAVVLEGRCYERESVPYKAFDGIVDALSAHLLSLDDSEVRALVPRDAWVLARLFPVLRRVPAIARQTGAPASNDPQNLRSRAFGALRELFTRIAQRQPLVLFIDDLQWGDLDSTALLTELTTSPAATSMLLLFGHREGGEFPSVSLRALAQLRDGATRDAMVFDVEVSPLAAEDAERLATDLLVDERDGTLRAQEAKLAAAIAREAGGSPFFVEELVRYARTSPWPIREGELRLEQVLEHRVRELAAPIRVYLEMVAVAARPMHRDVIRRAAGLPPELELAAVTQLRVAHLLRAGGADDIVEPYHDRVRESVVASLDAQTLRAHHEALATSLTEAGETDPEALFLHLRASGQDERALACAEAAADNALSALAFERAAQFLEYALELLPEHCGRAQELRVSRASALATAGLGRDAALAYLAAAEHAVEGDRLELRRRAAEQFLYSGHIDEGVDAMEAVLNQVGMKLAPSFAQALFGLVFWRAVLFLRGLGFEERSERDLDRETLARIDTSWAVAVGLGVVDNIRAAHFGNLSLWYALEAGEPWRVSRALSVQSGFIGSQGEATRRPAKELCALALTLGERTQRPDAIALAHVGSAWCDFFSGRWSDAAQSFGQAVGMYREHNTGTRWEVDSALYFELCSLVQLGAMREIGRRLPALMREANERGDLYFDTNLRVGDTNLYWIVRGESGEARERVRAAMARWSQRHFMVQHIYELLALGQCDIYEGRPEDAIERFQGRFDELQASFILRIQYARVRVHALLGCADLVLAQKDARKRQASLASALRRARAIEREGVTWAVATADLLRGGVDALRGDHDRATHRLEDAARGFRAADMRFMAAIAERRLAARVGGDRGRALLTASNRVLQEEGASQLPRLTAFLAPGYGDRPELT